MKLFLDPNAFPEERVRTYSLQIESGGHIMLDQTPFQKPYGGIFLYDIYSVERIEHVVNSEAWALLRYVGHCQAINEKTYTSTIGMKYDRFDTLLLVNTAPAGTYFAQARLTRESVQDLMEMGLGWWWPAWLENHQTGFVFVNEADMVAFTAVHEDTNR